MAKKLNAAAIESFFEDQNTIIESLKVISDPQ
jgi:hypothetical protein